MTSPIVLVVWKDEGDFGFITTYTADDFGPPGTVSLGVPYDPDRIQQYGSVADAQALADEHDARLELH